MIQNKKNIKLSYEFHDNTALIIEADRNTISQVIHNLLYNAVKFTNEGSITTIVERKNNNEIHVSIKDSGSGIHKVQSLYNRRYTKNKD